MKIITSHLNADFDAFASMVAAAKLYPDALLVFPGSQERKVRDFIEVFSPCEITRLRDIDIARTETLIIVDARQPDRIGPFAGILARSGLKIHIFDHHHADKGDLSAEYERSEDVGATATIFTEILREKNLPPEPMEATILALGIYEETGGLLYPSTTERDLQAVSYLLKRGANLNIVSEYLRHDLDREEISLLNELIRSAREMVISGIRIMIAKATSETYIGEAAVLAHRIMEMEDIDAVMVILSMFGKIIIVGRSKVPELDMSALLSVFGGGGHHAAASATLHEDALEPVEERILAKLPEFVRPAKVAADIMTSPVISIPADSLIKDAEDTMTRYGVNALPLSRDGEYTGLITRETVEKAIFHGFRKNPAADFSSTDLITVEPDSPLREIETLMIEHNQRFMPVLRGRQIAGAITRTDLLRVLYEEFLRKRRIGREDSSGIHFSSRNLASLINDRFPPNIVSILRSAGETAERLGYSAYLVGGSVRDLLLRKENLDLDLVIEGDGISFAHEFGKGIGAKVRPHHTFGTARITGKEIMLDIATARTEYYESPAALPKVETSSIKKDLYRRDFTINTLAIRLNPRDFGLLLDFFGGQRDMKERTIRVLHNLSFVEDPTRAFRAIRFSERFGFRLSRHTATLIRSAIEMGLFEKLSGQRLYDELILSFRETNPATTLKRLSEHGLLKVIQGDLSFNSRLEARTTSMGETIAWYNLLYLDAAPDHGLLYLMVLLSGLDIKGREETLARLSVPDRTGTMILKGLSDAERVLNELPARDHAELYHILLPLGLEALLYAMAISDKASRKKEISLFLIELKKVRPMITGEELIRLGIPQGPVYRAIFRELLDARLRGSVRTLEDEMDLVLRNYVSGNRIRPS